MQNSRGAEPRNPSSAALRIAVAVALALAFGLGVYMLLEAIRPQAGLVSFSFLLILPAAISAFVAYVADPWAERSRRDYWRIPVWILMAAIGASIFLLREGVICILLLSPLWLISGLAGAELTYRMRSRVKGGTTYCLALFVLPLAAIQLEPRLPLPARDATVSRSIIVNASPERIWPLLRGIPDVKPNEGRWNVSQDIIGVPRPLGARLVGEGVGAERLATWSGNIRFRERINEWRPGQRIGWQFQFDDPRGWDFTDRHLAPDSPYFRVTSGGYSLVPLGPNRTRVALDTTYWIRTPVNAYSAAWGQLFLGDLENNLLALVKERAERPPS